MRNILESINTLSLIYKIRLLLSILLVISLCSSFLLFFDNFSDIVEKTWQLPDIEEIQERLNYLYCVVGFFLLMGALFLGWQTERRIMTALREFSVLIDAIRAGDYNKKTRLDIGDELGFVIHSLNRLAKDLEKANMLRRKMLTGIAHELNTPLTTLRGNLEAMAEGIFAADEYRLQMLVEETIHLQRLVNDLRELSLAEAGELPLNRIWLDSRKEINHVLEMLEPLLHEKSIRVTTVYLSELPDIYVDKDRFQQILYNLIINAWKYSPCNDSVDIAVNTVCDAQKTCLEISISDNGIGIHAEDIPFVFEQFYRADSSRTKSTGGSGIGLAIVKRLVEAHGGEVKLFSQPGLGSRFVIILPLEKP